MKLDKNKLRNYKLKDSATTIRISKDLKKWLKDNRISPTKIFYAAVRSVGYKE